MFSGIVVNPDRDLPTSSGESGGLYHACCLLVTVFTMVLFGLTMLYSTSSGVAGATFFIKQVIWVLLGLSGVFVINVIGYRTIGSWRWLLLAGCAVLLLIADFLCPAVKGAHRWIQIPGIGNIQPSEFTKLALVIFLARYCSDNIRFLNTIFSSRGLLPIGMVCGLMLGLVLLGKDWGTTFLLALVSATILFIAGLRIRYLLLPVPFIPLLYLYLKNFDAERMSRLTTFLNPELHQQDDGYQLWHSMLALGSGFWTGLGFMESRMKAKYLPEAHTDFILSIVGEELGFIAILFVIFFYLLFIYFGLRISTGASTRQGMLLGCGITTMIGLQAMINLGVVSGAFPTKGMPAPFISYGGSNMLTCLFATGLLVNIALESAGIDLKNRIPVVRKWLRLS